MKSRRAAGMSEPKATESLSSCAKLHPNRPSQIKVSHCLLKGQSEFKRRSCSVCRSIRARLQPRRGRSFEALTVEQFRAKTPYRVLPSLNWTPPERVLKMLDAVPTNFEALYFRIRMREPLREATCN
jgi:hypothetical protein